MAKSEPIIVEATGYAGTGVGPALPLVELAMSKAVQDCAALGVCDDTPADRVAELTGVEGKTGAEFVREAKLAARDEAKNTHRGLIAAHEASKASAAHDARKG